MLSESDRDLLAFEETHWVHTGRKQNDIREQFGISAPRYYQMLGDLIQNPDAVKEFPQLTKRMLQRRDAHTQAARRRAAFGDD
jgi:hypothetical protein